MNNFNRPVYTKVFYIKPRARTRIQCTNNKNNSPKNNKCSLELPLSIRDILYGVSIATSLCSIIVNTNTIYTCYFELNDELIEVNSKLDTLVSRRK